MITTPQTLNKNQTFLRTILTGEGDVGQAIETFLQQHAALHSARVTPGVPWSYEDEILDGIADTQLRRIPPGEEHSIAWCMWHLARIEDVTMNMLLAASPQLLYGGGWFEKLNVPFRDTGNAFSLEEIETLNRELDLQALREYRVAVGKQTRQIIPHLRSADLKKKVDSTRIKKLFEDQVVTEETRWLADYWGGLTIAGLLLMPPTRHCIVHLNEAARLKKKRA